MFPDLCPLLANLSKLSVCDPAKNEVLVIWRPACSSAERNDTSLCTCRIPKNRSALGSISPARGGSSASIISVDLLALLDELDIGQYTELLDSKHVAMLGLR